VYTNNKQIPPFLYLAAYPLTFPLSLLSFTNNLSINHTNTQTHKQLKLKSIKMSAPNANAPNEGIVGQVVNSVSNAINYVTESIQGNVSVSLTMFPFFRSLHG